MSAELSARRTAAAAVLGDFQRATSEYATGALVNPDWLAWALRLGQHLQQLDCVKLAEGVLTDPQRATLGQALTDAVNYRDPQGICLDCDVHPAGLCQDHAEDLDLSDAYLALARELGIAVER